MDSSASDIPESTDNRMDESCVEKDTNSAFLQELFVGQQIDVLDTVGRWTEAEILKVDKERQRIYVSYIFWSSKFDEWVNTNDGRIAPLYTHTYNPPNPLKTGQRIEAMDNRYEWLEAFVIDENETEVKVHYKSYDVKFDEWIRRDSNRFRRYGPHRKNKGKPAKQWSVPVVPGARTTYTTGSSLPKPVPYHDTTRTRQISAMSDMYSIYKAALASRGLVLVAMEGDGNCLFRAVSHQIYGDDKYHDVVRARCMDYMEVNSDFFCQFVVGGAECFPMYVSAKRMNGVWGDDPEIQAMCEIYGRPAMIFSHCPQRGARCLRTFHEAAAATLFSDSVSARDAQGEGDGTCPITPRTQIHGQNAPMRLSYYGGGHFDSIVEMSFLSGDRDGGGVGVARCSNQHENGDYMDGGGMVATRTVNVPSNGGGSTRTWAVNEPPGVLEDRAIARARARVSSGGAARDQLEEAQRVSDREATDNAALELAIEASRTDLTGWGDEDLEACLMLSDSAASSTTSAYPSLYQAIPPTQESHPSSPPLRNFPSAGLSTPSSTDRSSHNREDSAEVLRTQEELIRSAAAQSEQEFIQKALEDSLKATTAQDDMEEALLRSAREASMQGMEVAEAGGEDAEMRLAMELSQLSEEEVLQRTLEESMRHQQQSLGRAQGAVAAPRYGSGGVSSDGDRRGGISEVGSLQSDEDAELQEAIRLSMMQHHAEPLRSPYDGMTDDDIAAAELEAAIQASMSER